MNIFSHIKSRITILEVVQEYATLKRAGLYWKGNCPFHHERTASFTVSPHREIFYCFGCHVGGDVIAFIAHAEKCTQLEAAKYLIDRYGIEVPTELIKETINIPSASEKEHFFKAHAAVAAWCHEQLQKNSAAQQYLAQRGINQQLIKQFILGYFPTGPQVIKQLQVWCQQQNVLLNDLISANILLEGKSTYSPFEDRLMFPITDHVGRFCGFGGRIFREGDDRPKYYNSHDHAFFNKGSTLFGLHAAKKAIQARDEVFLVEGYLDCIAMAQAGYTNTVATLGTSCTLEHLKTLVHYTPFITIVYDGDKAGQQAIARLSTLGWQVDANLAVISLPTNEDPASYLGQGLPFDQLYAGKLDIFSFFLTMLGAKFITQTVAQRVESIQFFTELVSTIADPLRRDLVLQQAATTFAIPLKVLKQELQKTQRPQRKAATPAEHSKPAPIVALPLLEKKLFCAIVSNISLLDQDDKEFLSTHLAPPFNTFISRLEPYLKSSPSQGFKHFFDTLAPDEQIKVTHVMIEVEEGGKELLAELLNQFAKKQWKMMVNNVKIKIADNQRTSHQQEVSRIIHEFQKLKDYVQRRGLI